MKRVAEIFIVLFFFASGASFADVCVTVDIDRIGVSELNRIKSLESTLWSVENGDELLACGESSIIDEVYALGRRIIRIETGVDFAHTFLARGELDFETINNIDRVLLQRRRFGLVVLNDEAEPLTDSFLQPVQRHEVIVYQTENREPATAFIFDRGVQDLVDEVDANRWFSALNSLSSFNRYSYNDGIYDAEAWLVQQFSAIPGMTVSTPGFFMGGHEVHNVVATLQGQSRPDDWIIVGGHYDSTSENPQSAAPGAEDNASGCAGVIEMAHIFANHTPEATMLFICYVGEEQGLLGSLDHVQSLVASGDANKVDAVLIMDMIGFSVDNDLDCLLESEEIGQTLIDTFQAAAVQYTDLRIEISLNAWGSDHVPYLQQNIPALLTIENDYDQYPDYHETTDVPDNIVVPMGREILKMHVAAAAQYAGSGGAVIFTDDFETGNLTKWDTVPDTRVAH